MYPTLIQFEKHENIIKTSSSIGCAIMIEEFAKNNEAVHFTPECASFHIGALDAIVRRLWERGYAVHVLWI